MACVYSFSLLQMLWAAAEVTFGNVVTEKENLREDLCGSITFKQKIAYDYVLHMTKDSLTPEEIEKNWDRFYGLLDKLGDRAPAAKAMVEHFGERLALAPASSRKKYHNCFPGGLVDHSIRVLLNANMLVKAYKWEVPKDSLIIGCLFHDLGKIGDLNEDLYLPQESDWHRDKLGQMYVYNESIPYMTVPDRGVWLCQHFGLRLTHDEFMAIKLNDGQYADENAPYKMKEPPLAIIVHTADIISTKQEQGSLE